MTTQSSSRSNCRFRPPWSRSHQPIRAPYLSTFLSTSTLVEVHTSPSPPAKFSNMAPREEDLLDEEPPSINPYEVLGVEKTASADEVKSAYRKAALKHHPGMKVTLSQLQLSDLKSSVFHFLTLSLRSCVSAVC
jgi:DnaJ domain